MPLWVIVLAALVAYVAAVVAIGMLLRRRRRELDRLWDDLYAWEKALREASPKDRRDG